MTSRQVERAQQAFNESEGYDSCPACGDTGTQEVSYSREDDERPWFRQVPCVCPIGAYLSNPGDDRDINGM